MIALHISIIGGSAYLWSECQHIGLARDLKQSVKAIGFKSKILKSNTEAITVWLPSSGGSALPSSPLIGDLPENTKEAVIAPVSATGKLLGVAEILELSSIARDGNIPGSGVIFGSSIFWTAKLSNIALKIVGEEKFIPSLFNRINYWEAGWTPVPGNKEEQQLDNLSSSMPAVCRCANMGGKKPDTPRRIITDMLLARLVNGIVRESNDENGDHRDHESLHDAWISALSGKSGKIFWEKEKEIRNFSQNIESWSRPVGMIFRSPFNLCFRLSEPGEKNGWKVDYLLQPKADQSIYMPVERLWESGSREAKEMQKFGESPVEFILAALGQASGLCPKISESLKRKNPGGFSLDLQEAFIFLKEYAQALNSAGFNVLLPSWWVGQGYAKNLGLKVRAKSPQMQGTGSLSLDSMVEFDFRVSLGDVEMSLHELKSLAGLKVPLVKIRGQWTKIDKNQISSAIQLLEKKNRGKVPARDILALALGSKPEMGDLEISSVDSTGWLKELLDKLYGEAEFKVKSQPSGFKGSLRPYQERGFSWISFLAEYGLGACLADDMGLGKTIQTLALIQKQSQEREERPVLVVCPTSVVNNWQKEAKIFTPGLKVLVHHGSGRKKRKEFSNICKKQDIVISSYGLLNQDIGFMREVEWAAVVLDEAQNIKNPETKKSKAARSLKGDFRLILTGTPIENHVGDLWALMEFLNPGLLGSQAYFKERFYKPIHIYGKKEAAARLKAITSPFVLRRVKTDKSIISDLPKKIEIKDYCNLTKEQASLYEAVVEEMKEKIREAEGISRRGLVLSTITRLKQVCNHPAQFAGDNSRIGGRSGKLQRLEEILKEAIELDERVLVFTQYSALGKMLKGYLQELFFEEVFLLHGGIPRKKRDAMVNCFQESNKAPHLFILSLKAGGTGLNLTRASHVIHYDRWWNPAVENQATDRTFRIGQDKNVGVHKFIVAGTLEERIDDMIESKIEIANQVIGAGDRWLTELSNEDFYDLIKLGSEATGE